MVNGKEHSVRGRIIRGILVIIVGLIIWFLPVPAGVKKEAWQLLAIFVATIFGLILLSIWVNGHTREATPSPNDERQLCH